jgi:hypothetical protein
MKSRRVLLALATVLPLTAGGCGGDVPRPSWLKGNPTTTVEIVVIEGRPLRRRNGRPRVWRSRRRSLGITDKTALTLDAEVRAELGAHWQRMGEMEHASIAAFEDLAGRLRSVRAPEALVERCRIAAEQEARHAALCFALAGRYLAVSVTPGSLRLPWRRPRRRNTELVRLAVESLRDGVYNERYAARLAAAQLDAASDDRVRAALEQIARDEAEHAALAVDVMHWCARVGGQPVVDALRVAAAELPLATEPTSRTEAAFRAHGAASVDPDRLIASEARDRAVAAVAAVVRAQRSAATPIKAVFAA